MEKTKKTSQFNRNVIIVFAVTFAFWVYLGFATEMTIAFDSIGYEESGKVLYEEGLEGYLKNGPQREPLYAYSISISMNIADRLGVDYRKVQTVLQILMLLAGQVLLYRLLLMLDLNHKITSAAVLYYGLSPGLISCGFDLYSEIITLPFILCSIFFICKAWRFSLQENVGTVTKYALLFAVAATIAVFSKAVLTIVYPLFILPFAVLLISALVKRNRKKGQCVAVFLLIFFIVFNGSLAGYKYLNQKVHGQNTYMDDRGVYALYTLAVRRTAPLTKKLVGIAITSIPGDKVCRTFFGREACHEWMLGTISLGNERKKELLGQNKHPDEIDQILISQSRDKILTKPFQYSFFALLEGLKMFFWESTKIGFVMYPDWMKQIHDNVLIKNVLRLLVGLTTLFSMFYLLMYLLRTPRAHYMSAQPDSEGVQCLGFMMFFLLLFIGLYALFAVLVRYSLPIAPVFICIIAFAVNQQVSRIMSLRRAGQ